MRMLAGGRWPLLRRLRLKAARLDDAAVAALVRGEWPALEELHLVGCDLREGGTRALASRALQRLRWLNSGWNEHFGDAGVVALASGEWRALEELHLAQCGLEAPPTLEEARRWAPALKELQL
jgi:hypothetical protein